MLIGYVRTSTAEQSADHQVDALRRAGVAAVDVHVDVASGAKASRPQLDLVLKLLRAGDTLVITRLDRLSRSVLHLVTLGAELRERGVELRVLEQGIDTSTVEGRAMFGMLSVLAELARELIVANTRDGLASARARGRVGGRRPRLTPEQAGLAQQLYDARDKTVQQIGDLFGVPRSTVYGHLHPTTTAPVPVPAADPAPGGGHVDQGEHVDQHQVDQHSSPAAAAAAGVPGGRVVDLAERVGPGWRLVQDGVQDREQGLWYVERDGARVGVVQRTVMGVRGRPGWAARRVEGREVPPVADTVATGPGSRLWRTRDLAAAGIARL